MPLASLEVGKVMLRLVGVMALGTCLLVGCGGAEKSTQQVTVGADDAAELVEPSEEAPVVGDVHRAQVAGRDLTVDVNIRPSYQRPPNEVPSADGQTLLHLERWLDRDLGRAIGWSVQVDPGDEANLFRFEVVDRFDSPLGTWTLHELGEDMFTHYMAMIRLDGLVFQVIGGAQDNPTPVIEMAQSMEMSR